MNFKEISPPTLLVGVLGLVVSGMLALALIALFVSPSLPSVESLRDVQLKVPLRVYAAGGELVAEYGEERRLPVQIQTVPAGLVKAILAAEDDAFYVHQGVDLVGILRAAIANLRTGQHGQGASTITMQVARNYFLSPEKTYTRKIKEILLALKIERELDKNQILELYVNKIFLGHRAYGFAAAAQVYYGKTLDQLALPEMAMLAGLPKAPSRNNPLSNPETARDRRNYVLTRMHKLGFIDAATLETALAAPLTASRHLAAVEAPAPYAAEMVRHEMVTRYGEAAYQGGYKVYTTIDAAKQAEADLALRRGLLEFDRRHGYRGPVSRNRLTAATGPDALQELLKSTPRVGLLVPAVVTRVAGREADAYTADQETVKLAWEGVAWARRQIDQERTGAAPSADTDVLRPGDVIYVEQRQNKDGKPEWWLAQVPEVSGAIVSLDPHDGRIVALSGGFDFFASKFNRVVQAERQPGSNIKPFIYSAALTKGFTAASRVSGAPIVVPDVAMGDVWRPENYSGKFFGPTRLRKALSLSLNLVSVRLLRAIGPEYTVNYLTRFGFDRERLPQNLSLALGTASLTPLEVVRGFAVFANGGFRIDPYLIQRIEDGDGKTVEEANPAVVCPSCDVPDVPEAQAPVAVEVVGETTAVATPRPAPELAPEQSLGPRYAPRAITAENAYVMTSMMRDVINYGTGRKALELNRTDLAGKTGTTNDYRDAWFSGFNTSYVTTVWVGFDQPQSLGRGEAGGRAALPIWIDYMRFALNGVAEKPLPMPPGVTTALINQDTGQVTSETDPDGYREFFIAGIDRAGDIDTETDAPAVPAAPGAVPSKALPEGLF